MVIHSDQKSWSAGNVNVLEPAIQVLVDEFAAAGKPAASRQTVEQRRQGYLASRHLAGKPEEVFKVEEYQITDRKIPVRIYFPLDRGPLPALVYFHGGMFISGDLETHDACLRSLANSSNHIIIAVDYRLAPEHKFPAAIEDAYDAVKWVFYKAWDLLIDRNRILVGGDSAGGNLAAVVCMLAAERQEFPIAYQLLLYPMLDATLNRESYETCGYDFIITKDALESGYNMYLPSGTDRRNPHVSPIFAENLEGLPPAYIVTAEFDPLRDEGEMYARRLISAGTPAISVRYNGVAHGFFQLAGISLNARRLISELGAVLNEMPGT